MALRAALVFAMAITGSFGTMARAEEQSEDPRAPPASTAPPPLAPESSAPSQPMSPPAYQPTAADPEPSTGIGAIIAGWVLVGVGVGNLATIPLCSAFDGLAGYSSNKGTCIASGVVIGAVTLGVGIPLLVSGYGKRSNHKAWERRNVGMQVLLNTRVFVGEDAGFVSYSASF